jgi:hypothetical protein
MNSSLAAFGRVVEAVIAAVQAGEAEVGDAVADLAAYAASLAGASGCPLHPICDGWAAGADQRLAKLGRPRPGKAARAAAAGCQRNKLPSNSHREMKG